jgi:hypothetical protein
VPNCTRSNNTACSLAFTISGGSFFSTNEQDASQWHVNTTN